MRNDYEFVTYNITEAFGIAVLATRKQNETKIMLAFSNIISNTSDVEPKIPNIAFSQDLNSNDSKKWMNTK